MHSRKFFFLFALFPALIKPASTTETGSMVETAPDDQQVQSRVPKDHESQGFGNSVGQRCENALMELMQKFPQYNEAAVEQSKIDISNTPRYGNYFSRLCKSSYFFCKIMKICLCSGPA